MTLIHSADSTNPKRLVAYVRLTESEFKHLESDGLSRGLSVTKLLKNSYFNGKKTSILMPESDRKLVLKELSAIGNNINQIAKSCNSANFSNASGDLKKAAHLLTQILTVIAQSRI